MRQIFTAPRVQVLALVFCVLAANAVFIGQAYHMDDGIYLLLARNAANSPGFPLDGAAYFEGLYAPDLASTEHPMPVTSYYMALIGHFAHGLKEPYLHVAFLLFPLAMACAMFAIARRYTEHPFMASFTLTFLPALYVLSHTLMTDVPQLALWVVSIALLLHGTEFRKTGLVTAGALTAALACFVSYASFCLIPLLAAFAISRKNYRGLFVIFIVPGVVLGAWLAVSFLHYGRLPPADILNTYFAVKRVLSPALLLQKLTYVVLAIGGVTIFPLGLLAAGRKLTIAIALLLAAPAMWISGALQYSTAEKLMFVFFFCAGLSAIGAIIGDFSSGRETELLLGAWFIGMLLFAATFYMTGSARYVFAAMPPLVLLFYRRLERLWDPQKVLWIGGINLAFGALLAIVLAAADYQFAGIYRDFASTFEKTFSAARRQTWFAGEWGVRAYLERSGARVGPS
jgi:MFS family permease